MKNNNFGRNFMQEITDQTTVSPDEIIWEFHKLHQKMYDEHGLTSLTGLNREYRLQGRNLLMWHSEATRKCSLKYSNRYYFSKNFSSFLTASGSETLMIYSFVQKRYSILLDRFMYINLISTILWMMLHILAVEWFILIIKTTMESVTECLEI